MMKINPILYNVPVSKSRVLTEPDHSEDHKQLTEGDPGKSDGTKISPFRKILKNLWRPTNS